MRFLPVSFFWSYVCIEIYVLIHSKLDDGLSASFALLSESSSHVWDANFD